MRVLVHRGGCEKLLRFQPRLVQFLNAGNSTTNIIAHSSTAHMIKNAPNLCLQCILQQFLLREGVFLTLPVFPSVDLSRGSRMQFRVEIHGFDFSCRSHGSEYL